MGKGIEELIGVLNLLDKINDTPYIGEKTQPEELRKNLKYCYGNFKVPLPIYLDDVFNVEIADLDEGNPIDESAIWVASFMMLYFETNIVLETDELAEVYKACSYGQDAKSAERFLIDIADASTSKSGNWIYSASKADNFWTEVQDMVEFNQLIILRLNDEFTILAGITKTGIIIRSRTGKMKLTYKQLEKKLTDIISIYSAEL